MTKPLGKTLDLDGLRARVRLRTIALAAYAASPLFAEVKSFSPLLEGWDGDTFLVNNGCGDSGAITFRDEFAVGVFFAHESPRSPFRPDVDSASYDWRAHMVGCPEELRVLAEKEALQFMLQELDGSPTPVITTALWGDGQGLTSTDDWEGFTLHSAGLLDVDLGDWELDAACQAVVEGLAARSADATETLLTADERQALLGEGTDLDEALQLLASVGIRPG